MISEALTLKYIYGSNCLDGVTLSLEQTRDILKRDSNLQASEEFVAPDGQNFEAGLVTGHRAALNQVIDWARADNIEIDVGKICHLHQLLLGDVSLSAGEFREFELKIKGLPIPSPAKSLNLNMTRLADLITRVLKQQTQDKNNLAWRVHHEFFTVHPFVEGNGRMARLLLNLVKYQNSRELALFSPEMKESYGRAIIQFQKQKIERMKRRKSPTQKPN